MHKEARVAGPRNQEPLFLRGRKKRKGLFFFDDRRSILLHLKMKSQSLFYLYGRTMFKYSSGLYNNSTKTELQKQFFFFFF